MAAAPRPSIGGEKDYLSQVKEYEEWQKTRIIGTGPFFCSHCGKQMEAAGHMTGKFFMCPDAGEFTPGPIMEYVVIDGVPWLVADSDATEEEVQRQREYYKQSREMHQMLKKK